MRPPKSLMGRDSFWVLDGSFIRECFVFVVTLTIRQLHRVLLPYSSFVYTMCIEATSLAYEQDWNRYLFEVDLPLSIPFQQAGAADAYIRVKWEETSYVYQSITIRRRITCRVTSVWPLIGSKFAKNSWKLNKVEKTRCTWPFQAKNRYDVTLANRKAPGVWFVLGFTMYLFLAPKWPGIPFFGKNPLKFLYMAFRNSAFCNPTRSRQDIRQKYRFKAFFTFRNCIRTTALKMLVPDQGEIWCRE